MECLFDEEAIRAFDEKVSRASGRTVEYTAEPAIRGLTVSLLYDKGQLLRASAPDPEGGSRDVTPGIKTLLTVPLVLSPGRTLRPIPDMLEAGGIAYLEHDALAGVNAARAKKALPAYRDAAEAAADALRSGDPRVAAKAPLSLFCTEVLRAEGVTFATHHEAMVRVQELGLRVNRPHLRICAGIEALIASCREIRGTAEGFPYEVKGVIIRVNRLDLPPDQGTSKLTLNFPGTGRRHC
jgi:DNA ligase (NAD+)